MRWEEDGCTAWARAGRHMIGHVAATGAPEGHPYHGMWAWRLTCAAYSPGPRATVGQHATKARAKMALVRAWRRWLDERGLVEREAADGMVREAVAKGMV